MSYSAVGRLTRFAKKEIKKRRARHIAAVKAAQKRARDNTKAQAAVRRSGRTTAGELVGSGDWKWEGSGMSPKTVVEPVQDENGNWTYEPVAKSKPRTRTTPAGEPTQCRGRTKNGTPCERIGNCPVKSHKKNKV